jgi:hypothetical protein
LKNSELIIEDYDGKVSFFKFNPDLSNITVTNRNGISSSLKMEWNHELPFLKTRIYVDQILALETAEDTAELDLTAGKHIVGIAQYSLEGEHFYQYYVVDVVKSDVIRMVVYVCAALAVLLAFILPFILKRRMGAGVNNV